VRAERDAPTVIRRVLRGVKRRLLGVPPAADYRAYLFGELVAYLGGRRPERILEIGPKDGLDMPNECVKKNQSVTTRARIVHFLEFFDRVDCIKCERANDLIEDCRRLLQKADEPGIGGRLKKQCAYFVEPSNRAYADRLNDLIHSTLSSPSLGSGFQSAWSPER